MFYNRIFLHYLLAKGIVLVEYESVSSKTFFNGVVKLLNSMYAKKSKAISAHFNTFLTILSKKWYRGLSLVPNYGTNNRGADWFSILLHIYFSLLKRVKGKKGSNSLSKFKKCVILMINA